MLKSSAVRAQYNSLIRKISLPVGACCLCSQSESDDGVLYGPLAEKDLSDGTMFTVHTICLKTTPALPQKFDDETLNPAAEGHVEYKDRLHGFAIVDVLNAMKRRLHARSTCVSTSCPNPSGALATCSAPRCRQTYHAPCARKDVGLFMYRETYPLHCPSHIPLGHQSKPLSVLNRRKGRTPVDFCIICHGELSPRRQLLEVIEHLCQGGVRQFMHWRCAQNMAIVQRSSLRCPLTANNEDEGNSTIQQHSQEFHYLLTSAGVYVPDGLSTYTTLEEDEQALHTLEDIGNMKHDPKAPCQRGKDCFARVLIGHRTDQYDEFYDGREGRSDVYGQFEMLGPCTTCGRYSHRRCAGLPWAFTDLQIPAEANDVEPTFVCPSCQDTPLPHRCPPWMVDALREERQLCLQEKTLPKEFYFPSREHVNGVHPDLPIFDHLFGFDVLLCQLPPVREENQRRRGLQSHLDLVASAPMKDMEVYSDEESKENFMEIEQLFDGESFDDEIVVLSD